MAQQATVARARRTYNKWVANETLEDFALRFTARRARKWSYGRVANTALGSISFLALEAIGGALTLSYGFANAVTAILIVGAVLMATALPISYHAARAGVDIDLLTRGAGFGYLGSTATSLIYATFTFIFFALEAAILALALKLCFGLPLEYGYALNALVVIPLVTHGFSRIGAFQKITQPWWVALHLAPFLMLAVAGADTEAWIGHAGRLGAPDGSVDWLLVGAASSVAFALIAQVGEQVDFLRFMPEPRTPAERRRWWGALLAAGPGWAVIGTLKMLAGSFLAVTALGLGVSPAEAVDPTRMYMGAFGEFLPAPVALGVTGAFVVLSQLKINVTNAYAGSIAWSNFFSRLTHSHPGRVVWLVFNVAIALMLMEFGVFGALEQTLALYAHVAVAWIAAITADLMVVKPLGIGPRDVEFRRAYLYDINPVGVGAAAAASVISLAAYLGAFGETAAAFSSFVALCVSFLLVPTIAVATRGRFYLARPRPAAPAVALAGEGVCSICEHRFDAEDIVDCPFHGGAICSLCCAVEARCDDACKPHGAVDRQAAAFAERWLPERARAFFASRYGVFSLVAGTFALVIGLAFLMIRQQMAIKAPGGIDQVDRALLIAFGLLTVVVGVAAWLHTLARESRILATRERERETSRLMAEIRAHQRTDARLQRAKELAEAANEAKSRYVAGISHELRTPLNAVMGYAQLLETDPSMPERRRPAIGVIRRSAEHLADLIEGLLDISKIEAGKLEVARGETRLRDLIDEVAAVIAPEARAKGLDFACEARDIPDRVHADAKRLRQILMNLLSNAVRYTDAGCVRFTSTFRNDVATFTVEDTGRGIAEEDRERIFRPFERVQNPEAPIPGTGLGLTITSLLVEVLGGELTFESAVGRGSRFRVRLMLPRIVTPDRAPAARRVYGYRGPRRRILVVDDEPAHRALIEDALRPLGFELCLAESAEAALAVVDAARPDLALLDVSLPGENGWVLAERLRREKDFRAPIVMVSAHAENAAGDGRALTFHDAFLAKPIRIDALLDLLESALALDWSTEAVAALRPAPLVVAPAPALDALARAASISHPRGVERALDALEAEDPAARAFVAEARRRLARFDMAGIEALAGEATAGESSGRPEAAPATP